MPNMDVQTDAEKRFDSILLFEKPMFANDFVDMLIAKVHDNLVARMRECSDYEVSENLLDDLCLMYMIRLRVAEGNGMIRRIDNDEITAIISKLSGSLDWSYEWGQGEQEQPS
jgi:hypothetical protein